MPTETKTPVSVRIEATLWTRSPISGQMRNIQTLWPIEGETVAQFGARVLAGRDNAVIEIRLVEEGR